MSGRPKKLTGQHDQLTTEYPAALDRIDQFIEALDEEERQRFLAEAADPALVREYFALTADKLREKVELEVSGRPNYVRLCSLREALMRKLGNPTA